MQCPNCGAEIGDNRFCEYCGSQISVEMKKEQEQLNKEGCPKCGSTNIQFNRENQGEVQGKNSKRVIHRTVGVCKDCGYTWYVGNAGKSGGNKTWLWVLGWLFIFPVPLTILMLRKKDMKPAIKYGIIAVGWIIYLIIASNGRSSKGNVNDDNEQYIDQTAETSSVIEKEEVQEKKEAQPSVVIPSESLEEPEPHISEDFEIKIDVSGIIEGSETKFKINTNLPDETVLMLTLSQGDYNSEEDVFTAQSKVTVGESEAISEGFSSKGNNLSGDYDLSISMSLPSIQSDKVRAVIGEQGEHMTGALVIKDSLSNSQNIVKALFAVSIGNNAVDIKPEQDLQFTIYRDDDADSQLQEDDVEDIQNNTAANKEFIEKYETDSIVAAKMTLDKYIADYKISLASQKWTVTKFDSTDTVIAMTDITYKGLKGKYIFVGTLNINDKGEVESASPHYLEVINNVLYDDGYCDDVFDKLRSILGN